MAPSGRSTLAPPQIKASTLADLLLWMSLEPSGWNRDNGN